VLALASLVRRKTFIDRRSFPHVVTAAVHYLKYSLALTLVLTLVVAIVYYKLSSSYIGSVPISVNTHLVEAWRVLTEIVSPARRSG
jgi:hypothetical protein